MESECYAFEVEWFDPQADLVKFFYLNYYVDGSIELVCTSDEFHEGINVSHAKRDL